MASPVYLCVERRSKPNGLYGSLHSFTFPLFILTLSFEISFLF